MKQQTILEAVTILLFGAAFLLGRLSVEPEYIPVNRPTDIVEVASGPGCTPDHYPDFARCEILVREWDQNGNVANQFTLSPADPISRIFE